jgi:transcriptional regulator with XRE-family HTH domain
MADPTVTFAWLLRHLRVEAHLSQEKLAKAAGVALRTVNDLERGVAKTARNDTARLLADALYLTGAARASFEASAQGHTSPIVLAGPPGDADPHVWLAYIAGILEERGEAAGRMALRQWQSRGVVEDSWVAWVDGLLTLTGEGRLPRDAQRPLPASDPGEFLGRTREIASLVSFLDRVRQGRGGVALVMGPSGIGKSCLAARALAGWVSDDRIEWVTLDRGEAGYQGWRRLLTPLWAMVRRAELAPAGLLGHALDLDDFLLTEPDAERARGSYHGEPAKAIAALLAQAARRKPVVLVIDDAHRGGISSDHLLLDVARRVNACKVGLIAALRPDELDPGSSLNGYCDQAADRDGADVVTLVQVPPLDLDSIAALIEKRQGVLPPQQVIEQVAHQTSGRPQLVNSIEIQRPAAGTGASWVVGKFGTVGQQVLRDTLDSRPAEARDFLRAAAVCADGKYADPAKVAALTRQPVGLVEQVLDGERRRGQILAPGTDRYCFQHDSWIEAIIGSCPVSTLRSLHARCLALLRDDPSTDPRQLAWHAIGAGTELVSPAELARLAEQAAEMDHADCAFSAAAGNYEVAARRTTGSAQTGLLIKQADALRFCGRWKEARGVLERAAWLARRSRMPGSEAVALIHLERLTWSYGLAERELTQQLRGVMARLPTTEPTLLAQVRAGLAMRLGITTRQRENEQADLARAAQEHLPAVTDPLARADILLGIRGGLHDIVSPEQLLEYDAEILDIGVAEHSVFHISEAIAGRITDLARAGRIGELQAALREHRALLERSTAPATLIYFQALAEGMLALARGEWKTVDDAIAEAGKHSADWGESVAGEALMAQAGWQLYETGKVAELNDFLAALPDRDVSSLNGPVWDLGAGLIHAENGEVEPAIRSLHDVCDRTDDLKAVPRGQARSAILATAAMVLGHPAVCDAIRPEEATRLGTSIAELLADHPNKFVLAGWPAVLLGSKDRYIGLAWLTANRPERATEHLTRAAEDNTGLDVLQTRAQFDLARAHMRQPGTYKQGLAELGQVRQRAAQLGMHCLAEQAKTEQERDPSPNAGR